jgi:hypothetical protein
MAEHTPEHVKAYELYLLRMQVRAEIHTHGIRGLFLINGGGAVALLAFIPQIWDKARGMIEYVVYGLIALTLGLLCAAPIHHLRYESSLGHEPGGNIKWGKRMGKLHLILAATSIACFAIGMALIVFGALKNIPE